MTEIKKPCACDYEACREVWKRVAPGEDPYPMADNANTQMSAQDSELTLPGAEANPCCMGSEASVSVEVLQGFLREELGDAQVYAYLSSCTPRREMARAFRALSEDEKRHARDLAAAIYLITGKAYCPRVCVEQPDTCDLCALLRSLYHAEACAGYNYARAGEETQVYAYLSSCTPRREMARAFRALSEDEKRHARDLAAAIYLITGKAYCPRVCVEQPDTCDLCALLRSLYHAEACAGYNYARAGEETLDLCLSKLFAAMSEDEYRHAELLMKLLGRKMNV